MSDWGLQPYDFEDDIYTDEAGTLSDSPEFEYEIAESDDNNSIHADSPTVSDVYRVATDHDVYQVVSESDSDSQNPDSPLQAVGLVPVRHVPTTGDVANQPNPPQNNPAGVVPQKAEPANNLPSNESFDDDGQICTICLEPWTNTSEHRIVSLRCGHLFGRSCITRWLKSSTSRCPQCNARARKSEIRNIYARCIKAIDTGERDQALEQLRIEKEQRRALETNLAVERMRAMMKDQECEHLKREVSRLNRLLVEQRNGSTVEKSQSSHGRPSSVFCLEKVIDIARNGGCRIVDICSLLEMILVTQPSTNDLFSGYGFRKIDANDLKPAEFVLVHQKPIKDMAVHFQDSLLLTASLDKSVKITNLLTNSVVHTYSIGCDVWSCAWDSDNSNYFYAGLKTGDVYLFDIRATSRHVYELPNFGNKTPVVSLQYLRRSSCAPYSKCGPVVGKLSDCIFYKKGTAEYEYKVLPFPTIGPYTSLSSEPTSGHILVTSRPSARQPCVTHTVCELMTEGLEGGNLFCNPVQTVLAGKTQVQLTRSKLLPHPDSPTSLLICAGDEDSCAAGIWDGSSGKQLDLLRTESHVLDVSASNKMNKFSLLVLTDKTLRSYNWKSLS